ncbi:MAG: ATP-dependent helicase, partial [Jiangellaceae bacterium]|nr:ATP-dependent helicase [Jiangellaceae bacterium]
MTLTPAELARHLGLAPPTSEQTAAIAAPVAPSIIVAGAGSGKTETMAARIVWLVANGVVRPEQVLGLTFTRKAARELAARIHRRLAQLAAGGVRHDDPTLLDGEPTVVTYDAFAGRIVAEHALRLGHEPGARLVTEAVCWQYATRVVESYDGEMHHVFHAPSTVADQVLQLHAELAGHLVVPSRLGEFTADLRKEIDALSPAGASRRRYYADVEKALAVQDARSQLVALVEAFRALKRANDSVDFADQAELAARLAEQFPEVGQAERERFRVVLLDEYQDTSQAQLVLLRSLFGDGHPVTAVGDPCQSIYGWRGASAGSLIAFQDQFRSGAAAPATQTTLTTSFRNGARILQVANRLAEPLRTSGFDVPVLSAFPRNPAGEVVVSLHLTAHDEAADVARRARAFWDATAPGRTAAVLVRARSQIPRIEAALRAVELPVQVVGIGGLLTTPEVGDVVATLRVLSDPDRGDALVRLLTGPRWRIGPRDLMALACWARRLASGAETGDGAPGDVDRRSIVDALDSMPAAGWFSDEGERRLTELAAELRALRRHTGQPLPDLVHEVVRALGVDVEVAARRGPSGRANLDRFTDVAAEFAAAGENPTLSAFLGYLDAAESAERGLRPGEVDVVGDQVQVLTVHGAKGLEWDAVFVAGLVDGVFPAGHPHDKAWLAKPGELPYPLRGDASALPRLDIDEVRDQRGLRDAVRRFAHECGDAERLEERRLAYVAATRARRLLVCTGYRWGEGGRPRSPSQFLVDVRAVCVAGAGRIGCWVEEPGDTNPIDGTRAEYGWPYDPLGARRPLLEAGAALVRTAMSGADRADPGADVEVAAAAAEWDVEIERLLAERERASVDRRVDVPLPGELSVSRLVLLHDDPDGLARAIRRPIPGRPAPLARRGTLFHAWLESRWKSPRLLDIDELPGWADAGAAPDRELAALQAAFLGSVWADRTPLEVEAPFELLVGGVLIRGRADAVFGTGDGGIDVLDWKTGAPPRSQAQAASGDVQLAAYRLAFGQLYGVDLGRVSAA